MATFTGTAASESILPSFVSPTVASSGASTPTSADDTLNGLGGNDTLDGGGGNNVLDGGAGNDTLIWNVGGGTNLFEGGSETDTAQVNGGGSAEQFTVAASGTRVRFDGLSPTAFSLDIGTTERLELFMGAGADTFSATGNLAALIALYLDGGSGNDTILGGNGSDTLLGGADDDFIDGNQGSDTAFLGDGNDVFQWDPGDGSDLIEGQSGFDTLRFNGSGGAEIFALSANGGRAFLTRNLGPVVMDLNDVEQIDIHALVGADAITVNDLTGTDVTRVNVKLGSSIGTTTGDGAVDGVTVNGGGGNDALSVSTGATALVVVTGAEAANDSVRVNALAGVDTIVAGGFEFALVVDGGTEADAVSYTNATAGVTVSLLDESSNQGVAAGHTYISIEGIIGSGFDDLLTGDLGSNRLDGGAGADELRGLGGNDLYVVDNAGDVVVETAGDGSLDRVLTNTSYALLAAAEIEILATSDASSMAAINLTGNAVSQSIIGNRGANILKGKGGDDTLLGRKGNDTLDGGTGDDNFVFNTRPRSTNIDTIKNYVRADDTIVLDNDIFVSLATTGKLSKSAFHASTSGKAHDLNDRILYETDTGRLYYDKDGTGSAHAIQFATLAGHPTIGASDFVIV
jgi:Ca2+-binding RTX toxin-like protein